MTQDVFHTTVRFLINKAQGGYFTPEQIDLMQNQAQMAIFKDYYDSFLKTQEVDSALNPFRVVYSFGNTDTLSGKLVTPAALGVNLYFTSFVTNQYRNGIGNATPTVKVFRDGEWGDAKVSQVDRPTAFNPIARELSNGTYEFYPALSQSGTITFLRTPKTPKYSYTQAGRVVAYIPSSAGTNPSVDPEWRDTEIYLVVLKTVELLGIPLSSPALVQYAQQSVGQSLTSPLKS